MFAVHNETIVDIPVVREMEGCVLKKIVVELVPRVFDQGIGDVAKGERVGSQSQPVESACRCCCMPGKCKCSVQRRQWW